MACYIPYFIGNTHNQMNSGTHYASLLVTVCARKTCIAELFITIYTQIINLYSAKTTLRIWGRLKCLLFLVGVLKNDLLMSSPGDSVAPQGTISPTGPQLVFHTTERIQLLWLWGTFSRAHFKTLLRQSCWLNPVLGQFTSSFITQSSKLCLNPK